MIPGNAIPPHLLPLMPKKDRPKGPAGMTAAEAKAECDTHSERELQKQISQYLTMRDIPFSNSRMDRPTTTARGVADFLLCYKSRFVAVEVKVGGNELTPEQASFRQLVWDRDGIYLICSRLEQLKAVLDYLDKTI